MSRIPLPHSHSFELPASSWHLRCLASQPPSFPAKFPQALSPITYNLWPITRLLSPITKGGIPLGRLIVIFLIIYRILCIILPIILTSSETASAAISSSCTALNSWSLLRILWYIYLSPSLIYWNFVYPVKFLPSEIWKPFHRGFEENERSEFNRVPWVFGLFCIVKRFNGLKRNPQFKVWFVSQ